MRDKFDAWQMEIASITWQFEKITNKLTLAEINAKPSPKSWSIAENLCHLNQVNSSYFPLFDEMIAGSYEPPLLGNLSFIVSSTGALLYRTMRSKTKLKTFPMWKPLKSEFGLDLLEKFNKQQMDLSAYVQDLEPFLESGAIIHSPASRFLVYELETAFDILIAHEKRHLQQCKNILDQ